jgi:fatty acid desaturase
VRQWGSSPAWTHCRAREADEQAKRDALAALLLDQAAATRASALDVAVATVRSRLAKAAPVQNANPLGAALEALLGAGASVLTAWQQAIVAAVFELCLVGVMVIFELLGHRKVEETAQPAHALSARASSRQTS